MIYPQKKRFYSFAIVAVVGLGFALTLFNFTDSKNKFEVKDSKFEVLFYNVENLFDTLDTKGKNDEEFTPKGSKEWDYWKLNHKVTQISKVILASDENAPEFIGFCEVENEQTLKMVTEHALLKKFNYTTISEESADIRGIDVGFAFKSDWFLLDKYFTVPVALSGRPTRDILFVEGFHQGLQKNIRFAINHWSSRWGGIKKSNPKRVKAAQILKNSLDSLNKLRPNYTVIIMGDFNDTSENESLVMLSQNGYKYLSPVVKNGIKSIKYKNRWYLYDGFFMDNQSYEKQKNKLTTSVIDFSWLLSEDKKYKGFKPNRSFLGSYYNKGFSDHLPVMLKWQLK